MGYKPKDPMMTNAEYEAAPYKLEYFIDNDVLEQRARTYQEAAARQLVLMNDKRVQFVTLVKRNWEKPLS